MFTSDEGELAGDRCMGSILDRQKVCRLLGPSEQQPRVFVNLEYLFFDSWLPNQNIRCLGPDSCMESCSISEEDVCDRGLPWLTFNVRQSDRC